MWKNETAKRLQVRYPIIQAPMAGGVTSTSLVSAVSNAGCLGMIGAGYMSAEQLQEQIREVKALTENPFGVNLFIPGRYMTTDEKVALSNRLLDPLKKELSVHEKTTNLPTAEKDYDNFANQLKVILDEGVPVCSFTFGIPSEEVIGQLKQANVTVVGTATTVKEAILNEKAGMNVVVVQGSEAGGHRGTFEESSEGSMIGLMSLVPQVVDQVNIPVIAAGGIMDGRGIKASFCLGAQGVQMGTAFLTCEESGANELHKKEILKATEDQTVITKAFSGKAARGIQNDFIETMKAYEDSLPAYPVQNTLTKGIRKAAATQGKPAYMSLWSGQSPRLSKNQSVDELITGIVAQAESI
ncbi:NAD(P)H-dependent flavin oxidoreductase [Pseudalkalibacillus caeni]|uniref:Probable nitronate monooxygenase n=1 Tax=Exobacillus caeni TaxID=2574798 RepID=A0A5R9F014_9BACL|nr:nitronate monooxygenase [Pseudalkalibacillus caeni]TLS36039.1 nitronate monooxygenase [Pseudalkalibacillus caeni]